MPAAAKTSLAGGVVGLSEVERYTGLFAENPRVMARRDQIHVAGSGLELGAVIHPEPHPAGDEVTNVTLRAAWPRPGVH